MRPLIFTYCLAVAILVAPGCGAGQAPAPSAPAPTAASTVSQGDQASTPATASQAPAGTKPGVASHAKADSLRIDPALTSDESLMRILEKDLGMANVTLVEPGKILFQVSDTAMALFRFPDGDLQLFYGVGGVRCPLEPINEWNKLHRHSRAYVDDEHDPVIESDLLSDGGLSHEKLEVFVRAFQLSTSEFQRLLIESCTFPQDRRA